MNPNEMNKLDYYKYNIMQGNTKSEGKLCCKKSRNSLGKIVAPRLKLKLIPRILNDNLKNASLQIYFEYRILSTDKG